MQFWRFCCAISMLFLSSLVLAEQSGWVLFNKVQTAVKDHNFDSSFVVLKGSKVDTFRWLHGKDDSNEIEHLIPLDVNGVDILRRNNQVYYLLKDKPAFVVTKAFIPELPAILFQPTNYLDTLYYAVAGSSSVMSGRNAQLLRLTAKDNARYSYWLWLDEETGFPIRIDTLSDEQNVLERWLVTHMSITDELPANLEALIVADLPKHAVLEQKPLIASKEQLTWLPQGFSHIQESNDLLQYNNGLTSYWLLSDGLHQISVFVQPAQQLATQAFRDGATTIYVQTNQQMEVTVIGPVNVEIAKKIAQAVQ